MATSTLNLPPQAGTPGDGSSGNASPQLSRQIGTETNPKKAFFTYDFDASTDEHLWFQFTVPQNYVSGGTVRIQWIANATTGNCVWGARVGAVTPADADTPFEHAEAAASTTTTGANATEANRLVETTIALANLDGLAAGDLAFLLVYRDADNGSDTLTVDARLVNVSLDYTS